MSKNGPFPSFVGYVTFEVTLETELIKKTVAFDKKRDAFSAAHLLFCACTGTKNPDKCVFADTKKMKRTHDRVEHVGKFFKISIVRIFNRERL